LGTITGLMAKASPSSHGQTPNKTAYVVEHSHYDPEWLSGYQTNASRMVSVLAKTVRILEKNPDAYFVIDQVPLLEAIKYRVKPKGLIQSYRDGGWFEVGNAILSMKAWGRHLPQKDLYGRVRKLVSDGRIQVVGGSYVQPDTNLPGGESLVRQNVYGREYFRETLGCDPKVGWNIDVFGQNAQLPQIMRKSGIDSYVFSRGRSKKDKEEGPSEFFWEGIDGTRMLTHCMPEHYNKVFLREDGNSLKYYLEGFANIVADGLNRGNVKRRISKLAKRLEKNASTDATLLPVGSDLRFQHSYTGKLARKIRKEEGIDIRLSTPEEFFKRVREESGKLETISGEFNPEFTGCYSSRIKLKQENRKCENLLISAEKLATIASSVDEKYEYPGKKLKSAWEKLMYNQFHDIMCGSVVDSSYKTALGRFDECRTVATGVIDDASRLIAQKVRTKAPSNWESIVVFNTLSWNRTDRVKARVNSIPETLRDAKGRRVPYRVVKSETDGKSEIEFIADVPSIGYSAYYAVGKKQSGSGGSSSPQFSILEKELTDPATIENEYIKVRITPKGEIESVIDKKNGNKEMLSGKAHVIKAFEDAGDAYYTKPGKKLSELNPTKATVKRERGVCERVTVEGILGDYEKIRTEMTLYNGMPRLEFETQVTVAPYKKDAVWNNHKVVVDFPINGGDFHHQIPYGRIKSPKRTIAVQDYVMRDGGLALINEGLPEHSITEKDSIELCLFRSFDRLSSDGSASLRIRTPLSREAGLTHEFRYALTPERFAHPESRAHNNGLISVSGIAGGDGLLPESYSFVSTSGGRPGDADITVLKKSEKEGAGVALRVVNSGGSKLDDVRIDVKGLGAFGKVFETDLLEENGKELEAEDGGSFSTGVSGFGINTYLLQQHHSQKRPVRETI